MLLTVANPWKNSCVHIGKYSFFFHFLSTINSMFSNYTTTKKYLLQRHLKSHSTERPHKCTENICQKAKDLFGILGAYCDRSFKTTIQLTNHVNTHLGVKPFQVDSNRFVWISKPNFRF